MGKKGSILGAIKTTYKLAKKIDRELTRQKMAVEVERKKVEREIIKEEKRLKRELKAQEREHNRVQKERERAANQRERDRQKVIKEKEKKIKLANKKLAKNAESRKIFSSMTVSENHMAKNFSSKFSLKSIEFNLSSEIELIKKENPSFFENGKHLKPYHIDLFLYNCNLNSVLGRDGFKMFKEEIFDIAGESLFVEEEKQRDFMDLIFRTGMYYIYEYSMPKLQEIEDRRDWKQFQRFLLKKKSMIKMSEITWSEIEAVSKKLISGFNENDISNLEIAVALIADKLRKDLIIYGKRVTKNSFAA